MIDAQPSANAVTKTIVTTDKYVEQRRISRLGTVLGELDINVGQFVPQAHPAELWLHPRLNMVATWQREGWHLCARNYATWQALGSL